MDFQLFESILTENGACYLWDLHAERMENSAKALGFAFNREAMTEARDRCLAGAGTGVFKMRIFLSEDGEMSFDRAPLAPILSDRVALSERVIDSTERLLQHKTTLQKAFYPEAGERIEKEGLADLIYLNERGDVTEGSRANVFYRLEGRLYTPPVSDGLLPGTFREHLLRTGAALERSLSVKELAELTELYIGNSVRRLLPVKLTAGI